jgi:hypothetical protein
MATAAEEGLARAIGEVLAERGFLQDGGMLGDWLVMVEIAQLEQPDRTKYGNIIPGDNGMPAHRVLGLIQVCEDMLAEEPRDG